jgi:hypothetical protein
MPLSALALGAIAERVGVDTTTAICGVLLAVCMLTVAVRVPELIRYGGSDAPARASHRG